AVLEGNQGPQRDIVVANAAAALLVAGRATDLKTAVAVAAESIDSGAAKQKLNQLIEYTATLIHETV
ncbi:MAG: anthranilate phosphoribosyltransferase, partial [Acidobacteriaceae bacterium]|nr:anthranilate phosphoribosyltransferase [Acidobacteriaceae bacterium]